LSAAVQQLAQVLSKNFQKRFFFLIFSYTFFLDGGNGKRGIVDLIINTFNLQSGKFALK
jgi:hypothetical protein